MTKFNLDLKFEIDFTELIKEDNVEVALLALGGNSVEDVVVNFANNLINSIKEDVHAKHSNVNMTSVDINPSQNIQNQEDVEVVDGEVEDIQEPEQTTKEDAIDFDKYHEEQEQEYSRLKNLSQERKQLDKDLVNLMEKDYEILDIIVYNNDVEFYDYIKNSHELNDMDIDFGIIDKEDSAKYSIGYKNENGEIRELLGGEVL